MKRILLFVHYNKKDKLDDRVLHTLKNIKHLFSEVIVISNSYLSNNDKKILETVSNKVIQRDNIGYDFSAWKDGIKNVGLSNIKKYDSLTIMNDTCHCPIWPLDKYFEKFDKKPTVDFWGASMHKATDYGMPGTDEPVPEHIQSYFITFKQNVIKSKAFVDFWNNVKPHTDVTKVIRDYEINISKKLSDAGFKYDAIINTENIVFSNKTVINPTFQDPLALLHQKFPFIKLKSISRYNLLKIRDLVKINSKYPVKYITAYGKDKFLFPLLYLINLLLKKTYIAFLAISIPVVIAFLFITPPGFGGDEKSHALRAYSISQGHLFTVNNPVPDNLSHTLEFGWNKAESAPWGTQVNHRQDLKDNDLIILNHLDGTKISPSTETMAKFSNTDAYSPIMYTGAAIGFWISKALGFSVHLSIALARLLNAIPFFILGALAIYILRKRMERWIIFTVLLLPTVLSYTATINGDPYNLASVTLFLAVFLRIINDNKKMSKNMILLLAASSILLSFAKLPSILLLGLLPFIKKDKFINTKDKWLKIGAITFIAALLALISMKTSLSGELGSNLATAEKISWSITHPIDTGLLFIRTLIEQSPDYINRAVGVMGRNGVYLHTLIIMTIYTWLVILALSIKSNSKKKGLLLLGYSLVMCAVVMGLLYVGDSDNKVGEDIILGIHGKYFTPFIAMAFCGLGALAPFKITSNKNYVGMATILLMIFISISSIIIYKSALY